MKDEEEVCIKSPQTFEWLLQQCRNIHLSQLRPLIKLPPLHPFELVEFDTVDKWRVYLFQLLTHTEEMVQPEQSPEPKHPIDIKQQKMQHLGRNPVAQYVH